MHSLQTARVEMQRSGHNTWHRSPGVCPAVKGQVGTVAQMKPVSHVNGNAHLCEKLCEANASHPVTSQNRGPVGHADREVMAATALTSLFTSPLVPGTDSAAPHQGTAEPCRQNQRDILCTRGKWGWHASDLSGPSPPSPLLSTSGAFSNSTHEDLETPHFLFEDPSPRKRKNSMKVMFKCLWKNCAEVLSTSSGIQRHVRTVHLGWNADSEHSDGEEDFYYSEIEVNVDTLSDGLSSLTPASPTGAPPSLGFPEHGQTKPAAIAVANGCETTSLLSQSAPSVLCHIHTDHAYQATHPQGIPASVERNLSLSFSWQSPLRTAKTSTVNMVNGEKRPPVQHVIVTKASAPSIRKLRGEARKCRKVYGVDRRDMWCTACRWKKACQRFTD